MGHPSHLDLAGIGIEIKNWVIVRLPEFWSYFCKILPICVEVRGSLRWFWILLSSWRQHLMCYRLILWEFFWDRWRRISGVIFWRKLKGISSLRAELKINLEEPSRGSMVWKAAGILSQKSSFLRLNSKKFNILKESIKCFVAFSAMNRKQNLQFP